jgi:hypothetical protein
VLTEEGAKGIKEKEGGSKEGKVVDISGVRACCWNREWGRGTYTSKITTLTRACTWCSYNGVHQSSNV